MNNISVSKYHNELGEQNEKMKNCLKKVDVVFVCVFLKERWINWFKSVFRK